LLLRQMRIYARMVPHIAILQFTTPTTGASGVLRIEGEGVAAIVPPFQGLASCGRSVPGADAPGYRLSSFQDFGSDAALWDFGKDAALWNFGNDAALWDFGSDAALWDFGNDAALRLPGGCRGVGE
jgi:hypothetical protein